MSLYSNKIDFISMGETQMGDQREAVPNGGSGPLPPLAAATVPCDYVRTSNNFNTGENVAITVSITRKL